MSTFNSCEVLVFCPGICILVYVATLSYFHSRNKQLVIVFCSALVGAKRALKIYLVLMLEEHVFFILYLNVCLFLFILLIALIPLYIQFYISVQQLQRLAFLNSQIGVFLFSNSDIGYGNFRNDIFSISIFFPQ